MEHAEAFSLYGAYFRGELDQRTREFHAHLNDCEDCKVQLRVTRASLADPGFQRLAGHKSSDEKLKEILRRNRTMTYVVIVVLICFLFLFRLKHG